MTSWDFIARQAWRDIRATRRRLLLLTTAVMTGVAALVAINSFTANLRRSVAEQAQALLGADLALQSRAPMDTSRLATQLLDSLVAAGGDSVRMASSASFPAMAYLPTAGTARLVQVRTVDPGWPWYGQVTTSPAGIWPRLQDGTAIVDPSLLAALGAEVGDSIAIGATTFLVAGTVLNVPGEVGLQAAFGARVFIATKALPDTRLLSFGARVEHTTYLALPSHIDPQQVAERHRDTLRTVHIGLRTVADDRDSLTEGLTRLGNFLGLVALAALLLGGLGTASAVHVLIRQRLDAIAVLRCLGATSGQVIAIHLLQAMAMGLLGAIAGALAGVALQQLLPIVLADFLPVGVAVEASVPSMTLGIALGVWTSAAFALLPLIGIRSISPLATLRRITTPTRWRWDVRWLLALAVLAASVVGLAAIQVGSLELGAWFAAAAATALVVLAVTSTAVIRAARLIATPRLPYLVRQGIANLHRPGNQTVTVVLSLGFGAFLLATLYGVQRNLLRDLRIDAATDRANLVLIDVQDDQRTRVRAEMESLGVTPGPFVPIVPMRIAEVNGEDVGYVIGRSGPARPDSAADGDDDGGGGGWAYRREYRSSYRDSLGPAERLVAGTWFTAADTGRGRGVDNPAAISVEREVATELGITLGDRVVWNVQGARVHTVVRSLREVNWARFEPNFFVVFAPGVLEQAPQTWVSLVRITDPTTRGLLQRALAERAPNVTTVDLGEVQRALESVIGRVVGAIRFMALFSLITGAVVLVGAIATSRWQRVREGTLLRTLGAERAQVLRILAVEYAALGIAASTVATVLASVAGWGLARFLFNSTYQAPIGSMLLLALGVVTLTTAVGLWGSLDVLRRTPLEVLRET